MSVIDKKVSENLEQYIKQCFMATGVIIMLILVLDVVEQPVIIATLGATTFIVFAMSHSYASQPRRIYGGYALGILVGLIVYYLEMGLLVIDPDGFEGINLFLGGLAIGASIFLMVFTNTEHPPAAGLSMGLLFNPWSYETILVIIAAIIFLNSIKYFLRNWLIDLHGPTLEQVAEDAENEGELENGSEIENDQ